MLSALGVFGASAAAVAATTPAAATPQFIYVLRVVPRLYDEKAWTAQDNIAVGAHFARLQAAVQAGSVILAGRTSEPLDKTFGLVVYEAADLAAAEAFARADPAVVAGVMTVEVHPYSVALLRK
ncbi:MAG: YciI family protein [Gemmatimonadaceae bacterium]|nr:YciI family protein [Gemmatimonadaceae bacterium]